ncbi:MAG: hypothetical protein GOU97_02765 [Nanoarchaeota archaeon]|nr:hypothetical protein [Nanoarchaeota archaeon]
MIKHYRLRQAKPKEVDDVMKKVSRRVAEGYSFSTKEGCFQVVLGEKVFVIKKDEVFVAEPIPKKELKKKTLEIAEKAFKEKLFKVYKGK